MAFTSGSRSALPSPLNLSTEAHSQLGAFPLDCSWQGSGDDSCFFEKRCRSLLSPFPLEPVPTYVHSHLAASL